MVAAFIQIACNLLQKLSLQTMLIKLYMCTPFIDPSFKRSGFQLYDMNYLIILTLNSIFIGKSGTLTCAYDLLIMIVVKGAIAMTIHV